jgi:uncharacterized protein YtpQ (UPF0354 family)
MSAPNRTPASPVLGMVALAWTSIVSSHAADTTPGVQSAPTKDPSTLVVCGDDQASLDAFADMFRDVLPAWQFKEPATYDPKRFAFVVKPANGGEFVIYLGHVRKDYCEAPVGERAGVLRYFMTMSDVLSEKESDLNKQSLLPAVRARSYFTLTDLEQSLAHPEYKGATDVLRLGNDIVVHLAADEATTIRFIDDTAIAKLGLTPAQALDVALRNLRRMSRDDWIEVQPGVFKSGWHDDYDPARLLLTDMIGKLRVRGNPVAIAPDNNTLLVTGSGDVPGLLRIAEMAGNILDTATRPLSGEALELVAGQWKDFAPDDPTLAPLVDVGKKQLGADYDQQKRILDDIYEKKHIDIFVANFMLFRREAGGQLTSVASWANGVVTLLPRTDMIAFTRWDQEKSIIVRWSKAVAIVGPLMTKADFYPERYRVEGFPDDVQWAKLKGVAE